MTRKQILQVANPMLSMLILTLGNGLYTTITTLQLKHMQMTAFEVGLISAAYFAGLMVGPLVTQRTIIRVGHIRSYGVFAAIMTVSVLLQGAIAVPWLWAVLRFLAGYALAGLFICIESWVLAAADSNSKGRILAFYLLSYYVCQATSQLLLKVPFSSTIIIFVFISLLAVLSILPVMLTRFAAPFPEDMQFLSPVTILKKAPLGMWAALVGGMVLGSFYTMYPLVLAQDGFNHGDIATLMFVTILGGASLQLPIGKWSDLIDRRKVLFCVCVAVVVVCGFAMWLHDSYINLVIISCLVGGVTFVIYPLSISYTGDYLDREHMVSAITVITVIYGVGSMVGPLILPFYIHTYHLQGYFAFMITMAVLLGVYTLWRIARRKPAIDEDLSSFTLMQPEAQISTEQLVQQLESDNDG